jgi:hypothetical protein
MLNEVEFEKKKMKRKIESNIPLNNCKLNFQ